MTEKISIDRLYKAILEAFDKKELVLRLVDEPGTNGRLEAMIEKKDNGSPWPTKTIILLLTLDTEAHVIMQAVSQALAAGELLEESDE